MINFTAPTVNCFLLDDAKVPSFGTSDYVLNVAIREYGQATIYIPAALLSPAQITSLESAELGYALDTVLVATQLLGNFERYRKTATSRSSLIMRVVSMN